MKIFQKTWFAILLCLVLVAATTLLNTKVKFGGKCAQLSASMLTASDRVDANGMWQDFMRRYDKFPTRQLADLADCSRSPELPSEQESI